MIPSKKVKKVNLQRVRTKEEREEARMKKYRYLYRVRTAHGDVISQVKTEKLTLTFLQEMNQIAPFHLTVPPMK